MNNFLFENKTKIYFGKGGVKEYLGCLLLGLLPSDDPSSQSRECRSNRLSRGQSADLAANG